MPLVFSRAKELYLFHHVGKCAGTTLVHALGHLGRYGISLGFPAESRHDVRRYVRRELVQRKVSPHWVRAFFGHRVYYGLHHLSNAQPRYFTFLRNPRGRVRSLYRFHCDAALNPKHPIHDRHREGMLRDGEPMPFEEWLQGYYVGNQMVRFCAYAMRGERVHEPFEMNETYLGWAKEFLDKCWFIGFTESSDNDMNTVCQAIGVRAPKSRLNQSKFQAPPLDKLTRQLIDEREYLDWELFEYAKSLRGN